MKKIASLGLVAAMFCMTACQNMPEAVAQEVANAELRNTLWKLTSLDGEPVQAAEGQGMASLTLMSEEPQARIVTACNRGSAGFSVDGAKLKFDVAMSTKMMCPPPRMQQEAAFFKAIGDTAGYAIKGETLELYNAENKLLASFQAQYLE